MKVEVWSDIMCPFCYIGKRNYEKALSEFAGHSEVETEWHSFQLDPTIPSEMPVKQSVYQYLAEKKGMTVTQSEKMHLNLVQTAKKAGLDYHFEKAVIANSYDAHRVIQLAKMKGLGDEAEERLFRAYFTEGKDIGNHQTLMELGKEIGLPEKEILPVFENPLYAEKVNRDIQEAEEIGIGGVPFFIFNRKYAISGAQPPEVFLKTLELSFQEWKWIRPSKG